MRILFTALALCSLNVVAQPTLTYLNSLNQKDSDNATTAGPVIAGPMLDASGSKMIFSQEDGVYFTAKSTTGAWNKPVKVNGAGLSTFSLNGVAGFDGRRLFFNGADLKFIELQADGSWSKPQTALSLSTGMCESFGSLESHHEKLAIANDLGIIVFSKYDKARKDVKPRLYFATKDKSRNAWAYSNCRTVTQQPGTVEIRPTLLPDGKTLLYTTRTEHRKNANETSSVDRQYVTRLLDDGTWALPQPTGDENYFYTWSSANMDTAYFRTKTGRIGYAVDPQGVIIARPVTIAKREGAEQRDVSGPAPVVEKKPTPVVAGRYYALLIGVSDYDNDKLDLTMPVRDVLAIKDVLTSSYTFDENDITVLDNPTRQQIFREFFRLRNTVTERDNLLIFFAGHGSWDKKIGQGYWWPSNSAPDDPSNWLSNSDLREQIRGIQSAHTLLISDACFSGGIFRTRNAEDIKKAPLEVMALYRMKSRRAITSGALSSVPDESVFTRYLLTRLNENPEDYLPSQSLFNSMRLAVIHNSLAVPQDGVIGDAGDEGGDFIFIRRQ
jgi:hypothetical protein